MLILSHSYLDVSSVVYLAMAVPLCLWAAGQTREPLLSGVFGSLIAVVAFSFLGFVLPADFGGHVHSFVIRPFIGGGWQMDPSAAFVSLAFHIGVPTVICVGMAAWAADPR